MVLVGVLVYVCRCVLVCGCGVPAGVCACVGVGVLKVVFAWGLGRVWVCVGVF